jgi:tRNA threonylcarbamoyl adenosine modification protein YeaZ
MELSIDTASEVASVALSVEGRLEAEVTWRCHRNHTVELLPAIEQMLARAGAEKSDISAVFACTGPGMYTGLRVGISTAQGLARALGAPALGVGRLELDAYPHATFPGVIVAVHRAGRGDLAWASYMGAPWREVSAPRLSKPEELGAALTERSLLVGEVDEGLLEGVRASATVEPAMATPSATVRRAATLAELGFARLSAGAPGDPALVLPVYLRPPVIGPPKQRA